ncbi:lipopolysaccharide assembly protein LapA domain-containing protein [Actinoallomurus purpureus]|uniref:lipopolysaccharide assembly protein LapA domain-containing protein n=1 Tax=Actinoallomurus purpureus TaxID=478114 RepID=UPI0020936434|nr:lipopolysaccharide assembly protein LapA domain-containing protein [Actinoallomurus purpureus]MCO6008437.1 lipopolysaccharide assembly protein LapA domain-containing protein [Actinoallomurus purpureus]
MSASRTSVVWAGAWAVAIVLIAVIVFILQKTRSVQVSFFGLHGALPLAVGLLIAMVAGVVVTLVLGTARITQVRRLARRRR